MTTNTVPGISALQCVISSLRDTAHLSDEGGELTDQLRELRDWALSTAAQPPADGALNTIAALRAQLAEAQRDAERLDWIIEHRAYVVSDPDCCDGYWLNYARPDGTMWTQATEHETPRAAIDAARTQQEHKP